MRQNRETRWPLGVLSGSMVIDMLETLSRSRRLTDHKFTLSLQAKYIEPFARIDRMNGLVVTQPDDHFLIFLAHERYIQIHGKVARAEDLWVPGLEPLDSQIFDTAFPPGWQSKAWTASEMYAKNGIEVMNQGTFQGSWIDGRGWDRSIWTVAGVGTPNEEKDEVSRNTKAEEQGS